MNNPTGILQNDYEAVASVCRDFKHNDPTTTTPLNKFQKEQAKLRKEGMFDNKIYCKVYQSHAIPLRFYGVTKVHNREKTA